MSDTATMCNVWLTPPNKRRKATPFATTTSEEDTSFATPTPKVTSFATTTSEDTSFATPTPKVTSFATPASTNCAKLLELQSEYRERQAMLHEHVESYDRGRRERNRLLMQWRVVALRTIIKFVYKIINFLYIIIICIYIYI